MKRVLFGLIALAGLTAGTAQAALVSWSDSFVETPNALVNGLNPFVYTHDITDNGFDVGQDLVTSFRLTIDLYDDNDSQRETASVDIWGVFGEPGVGGLGNDAFTYTGTILNGAFLALVDLNLSGTLTVSLTATRGDFYFSRSDLVAYGVGTTNVPEPATLGLLGMGLLGVAAGTRRRKA